MVSWRIVKILPLHSTLLHPNYHPRLQLLHYKVEIILKSSHTFSSQFIAQNQSSHQKMRVCSYSPDRSPDQPLFDRIHQKKEWKRQCFLVSVDIWRRARYDYSIQSTTDFSLISLKYRSALLAHHTLIIVSWPAVAINLQSIDFQSTVANFFPFGTRIYRTFHRWRTSHTTRRPCAR